MRELFNFVADGVARKRKKKEKEIGKLLLQQFMMQRSG